MEYLPHTASAISVVGVLVIVFGALSGVGRFVRSEVASARGANVEGDRHKLRQMLGYYLLLGLEFLIAADIIETLLKPEPRELIVLGSIVGIRTVISYSLNLELTREAPRSERMEVP